MNSMRINKKKKLDSSLDAAVSVLKEVSERMYSEKNDYQYFGNHIAKQLQSLPEDEAIKAEADIHAILTAARVRAINRQTQEALPQTYIVNLNDSGPQALVDFYNFVK